MCKKGGFLSKKQFVSMRWRLIKLTVLLIFGLTALLLSGPLWMLKFGGLDLHTHWSRASMDSPGALEGERLDEDEVVIRVYAARAYGWRGAFADHCWIAVRNPGEAFFRLHEVIGWRHYRGMAVVSESVGTPNRSWFGNPARLLGEVRGQEAVALIPRLNEAIASYPAARHYRVWPGPNSNTFIAHVLRHLPELQTPLPATAIGKDFPTGLWLQPTPGGSGWQLTLWGLAGVSIGWNEGLRFQWLAMEFGLHPFRGEVYWPGLGAVSLFPEAQAKTP